MVMTTSILEVRPDNLGLLTQHNIVAHPTEANPDILTLQDAAYRLRTSNIPIAFPTETVYGLGADATRSEAVRNIFRTKRRPVDNPLIVHVCSLEQLHGLLQPLQPTHDNLDPIPPIYSSLIRNFWPGPLTIVLPLPLNSPLAPEVTCGLPTFCARMPDGLSRELIRLANVPLAAPSANASGRPSPTTAFHVLTDLHGEIEYIIDGGQCKVGLESTIVDGLVSPPRILRPGGVSIEQLRLCPGWENVVVAYEDGNQMGSAPLAPGMSYRHYSPAAPLLLFPPGSPAPDRALVQSVMGLMKHVGIVATKMWAGFPREAPAGVKLSVIEAGVTNDRIAYNLFAALRELDLLRVDVILVESIRDNEGPLSAAIMNRLRKAAAP